MRQRYNTRTPWRDCYWGGSCRGWQVAQERIGFRDCQDCSTGTGKWPGGIKDVM